MHSIKYNLNGGWIAPPISMMLDKAGYEKALEDVISCQMLLSDDLSKFDMRTNEGHAALCNAALVSSQLRLYRGNVESLIDNHVDPIAGQSIGVNQFEIAIPKNRGDKTSSTRKFSGVRT